MSTTINQSTFPYQVNETTVSGLYNASNTTYTLGYLPVAGSLNVFNASGLRLRQGTDFTIAGKVLTATIAPESGDNWIANYTTQG